MGCKVERFEDGSAVISCSRGARSEGRCEVCRQVGNILCDYKGDGGTCDMRLCRKHARQVGKNLDYCPRHAKETGLAGAYPDRRFDGER